MKVFPWPRYWGWNIVLAVAMLIVLAIAGPSIHAQSVTSFVAGGLSTNGTNIAASGLYGRAISPDTAPGMYAFAMYDVLPTSAKPFTVTNNVGVGIAQRAFTIGKYDVLVPTAAGISYTGANVGWAWNTGAMVPIRYKATNYFIAPAVRVSKSSIGGDGYQPILSVLFGFGK